MILERIVERKKEEVSTLYKEKGLAFFEKALGNLEDLESPKFKSNLNKPGLSLIAEVKKASPSKGIIREDFDPVEIAKDFESTGATALSVLTDEDFFQGELSYLETIKTQVSLPLLRKDFIIDPIQVYESKAAGADAILLILKILSIEQFSELSKLAKELSLDVLIETHKKEEIDLLFSHEIPLDHCLLGINNRNLETFETDIRLSLDLKQYSLELYSHELPMVAESGYSKLEELDELNTHGFSAVLIGEGLAKNPKLLDSEKKEG